MKLKLKLRVVHIFIKEEKLKLLQFEILHYEKKAEQQLKENEERLKYFFSITSEGILLINNEKS